MEESSNRSDVIVVVIDFGSINRGARHTIRQSLLNEFRYLMLEGTDGQVHYGYYTPELEAARRQGGLRTDSFVRLRKLFSEGYPALKIDELGDSKSILRDKQYLRETARRLIQHGIIPQEDGWTGWLGQYQKALHEIPFALDNPNHTTEPDRVRRRDHGR